MSLSCIEFRNLVGADPENATAAVSEHRLACRNCASFREAQLLLTRQLRAAMQVPVPPDLEARIQWKISNDLRLPWRKIGMAAGFVLAVALTTMLAYTLPTRNLAQEVVRHIEHEPQLLNASYRLVEAGRLEQVLRASGMKVDSAIENVSHAGLCPFRGKLVPHLVMRVDDQPVSVLIITDQHVRRPHEFSEDGYHGMIYPGENGSIAIVADRSEWLLPAKEQLDRHVHWGI